LSFSSSSDQDLTGDISGTGALTKSGSGEVILSGVASYTGNTTVNAGKLRIKNTFGNSDITVNSGGVLLLVDSYDDSSSTGTIDINSGGEVRIKTTVSNNITISGIGSGDLSPTGAIITTGGSPSITGLVTLDGDATVAARSSGLSFNVASGNAFSGTGDLTLFAQQNITVNDPIAITGDVIKEGSQTLYLYTDNSYSGATVVKNGSLTIGSSSAGSIPTSTVLTFKDGGAAIVTFNRTSGTTIGGIHDAEYIGYSNQIYGSSNGSDFTINVASGENYSSSAALDGDNYTSSDELIKTGAGSQELSGQIAGFDGIKVQAGTLTLSGGNTFSGNITVSSGATLEAGYNSAFSSATVVLNSGAKLSANNTTPRTLSSNDITLTGTVTLGDATKLGNLGLGDATLLADTTVIVESGVEFNALSGNYNFIKNGAGTLTIASVPSTSNTTTVNAGTLLSPANGDGNGTFLRTGQTTVTGGELIIRGSYLGNQPGGAPPGSSTWNTAIVMSGGKIIFENSNVITDTSKGITGSGGIIELTGNTSPLNASNIYYRLNNATINNAIQRPSSETTLYTASSNNWNHLGQFTVMGTGDFTMNATLTSKIVQNNGTFKAGANFDGSNGAVSIKANDTTVLGDTSPSLDLTGQNLTISVVELQDDTGTGTPSIIDSTGSGSLTFTSLNVETGNLPSGLTDDSNGDDIIYSPTISANSTISAKLAGSGTVYLRQNAILNLTSDSSAYTGDFSFDGQKSHLNISSGQIGTQTIDMLSTPVAVNETTLTIGATSLAHSTPFIKVGALDTINFQGSNTNAITLISFVDFIDNGDGTYIGDNLDFPNRIVIADNVTATFNIPSSYTETVRTGETVKTLSETFNRMIITSGTNSAIKFTGSGTLNFDGFADVWTDTDDDDVDDTIANGFTGNIIFAGPSVTMEKSNEINDSSNVTIESGTVAFGNNSDVIASLTVSGGTVTNGTGTIAVTNTMTVSGGSVTTGTFSAGSYALSGGVVNAALAGSGVVTVTGDTRLGGANTFSGAVNVNSGTLRAESTGALGSTAGSTTVASGASLHLYSTGGTLTINEALNLTGTGVSNSGALQSTGTVTLTTGVTLAGNTRIVTNSGSTFTLSDTSTGIVGSSGNYNLTLAGAGDMTVSGPINLGTGTLTKGVTGTLTLSGALTVGSISDLNRATIAADITTSNNQTYSGGADIGPGTITLTSSSGNVIFSDTVRGIGTSPKPTVSIDGNLVLNSGANVESSVGVLSVTGTSSLAANVTTATTQSYTGAITLTADSTLTGTTITAANINNDGNNLTINTTASNSAITGVFSGSGNLTKSGSGNLTLSGTNTSTGDVTVSAGTLTVSGSLDDTSDVTVASGATYSVGASDTISSLSGAGTTALGSNNLTLGSNSSTTYSGTLTGSGNLVKSGTGQLTLSGTSSSFTGGVNITGGKVSVSSSANLGATPGSADADNITLNGGTLKSTAEFTLGTNKGITLGSSGGTIETATSASDILTYGGVITGSGNLTKTGNGILLLSGDNTYTGTTTISSGILRLSGSLDSTTINISGNGTQMQVNSVNGLSSSASISIGTGSTLALNENNTINSVSGTGKIRVNNNKELTVSSTTFTGLVLGSGDLIVDGSYTIGGSGNMRLGDNGADNDINTIVSGASTTLNIGSNNALSTTHNLTVQNNAAFNMGAFQQRVSTVDLTEGTISGTSSGELEATTEIALKSGEVAANTNLAGSVPLNKTTGGTVDFKGRAKHTGATNISAGTMNVTGSIENTSAVNVSGGTLKLNSTNAVHSSAGINVTGGALEVLENITVGDFEASGGTVTLGSGKQLTINPTTNLKQITGLTGSGKFKKTGSQTTILTGTNSYTGETRVSGGTLRVNSSTALSASTDVVVESGTILDVNSDITVDTVSDAGDVDVASGSTFTVSDSENKTFAGRLRGSGNFAKTGSSTMTLTGQSDLSGTVTVSGGVLYAGNASSGSGTTIIDNDVTVSGGKLGGGGRISGTVTVNSGSLVPGNSIGTLYIGGDLDLTSSSTTEIEFNASASDKIVVSGDITVAGTIILKPENVTYASTSYVIIDGSSDTSQNFSGSFSTVTVSPTSNLNGATASLTYNNALQQVILNLTASSSDPSDDGDAGTIKAKSSKLKTLADIFDKDTANAIASSGLKTYWKSLDSVALDKQLNEVKGTVLATSLVQTQKIHNSFQKALTNVTAMGATSTVGNITRSSGSNLTLAQLQEAGLFKDKNKWSEHWDYSDNSVLGFLKNNKNKTILSGKTSQDRAAFIRTYGGQTKRDDIGSTFTGYKNDTFGILFGEQIRVASNVFSGYSYGFSGSDTDYNDNNGESRTYAAHASVFKQFDNKKNNVNLIAGGYISNTDSDRKVTVGSGGSAVNNTYNSEMTDIGINATAQYTHKLNVGSWNFSPTVSLQGSYEIKDDTKEKGSGNFALNVKNDDLMTLKPEIGFSLDKDFSKLEEERNQFNFSVFASQDHYLDGTKSTANYASNPSNSFQLKTPRDEETYLSAGIGYNYVNDAKKTNFIANAFYSENTDNDLESNIISITYRKLFGDFGKDGLPPIVAEKPEDDEDGVIDQAIKTVKKALVFKKPSCNEGQVYRAFECGPSEETLQLVANKLYEINKREPTLRDKMLSWYISISYYLPLITFIMFVILIYEVLRGFVIASFRIDNRRIVVRKNKPGFIAFVKNYFNENFEYI